MKKFIYLIGISVLILTGCSTSANSMGDDKLVIWSFFEGPPKLALDTYEDETGNNVEFVKISYDDFQTKLNTVIGTSDQPDIVALEKTYVGSYITNDNFMNYEDLEGIDVQELEDYKQNTSIATAGPGMIDNKVKGISWGVNSSAFFYRSDLASECLNINSIEDMEKKTQSISGYYNLQDELRNSTNDTCSSMSLISYPDYVDGLIQRTGMLKIDQKNKKYVIPKDYDELLKIVKYNNDNGVIYSPQDDKTQVMAGNEMDAFLGNIAPAWATQEAEEYNQPGKWAIADTPLDFSAGGTYLAVTNTADQDMVSDYFNMTFLNEDWYLENMNTFNIVANKKIMNDYFENNEGDNPYYGGENSAQKLVEIDNKVEDYDEVTPYDSGIVAALNENIAAYAIDGTISSTIDAKSSLKSSIETTYPDLTVEIEE